MDKTIRELLGIAKKLLTELRGLASSLLRLQKQVETIRDNTEASKKAAEKEHPFASRITVDVNFPSEKINRYYAEYNKPNSLQWWVFFVSVLTFIAVTVYAVLVYFQWKEMIVASDAATDAANQSRRSVAAADRALAQARDQFRQDQRPYIWTTPTGIGNPEFIPNALDPRIGQIVWTFHYTAYGKSPAYDVLSYKVMRVGIGQPFRESYGFSKAKRGKGTPLPPNADYFETVISSPGITPNEYARLLKIDHAISIRLRFEYVDGYGGKYETGVCLGRLALGAVQFCPEGNYIK
jgi:hypothetical protein